MSIFKRLILLAFCLTHAMVLAQIVDTVYALKDNTLYESLTGSTSNGAGDFIFSGKSAGGQSRRAVILFDVVTNLPAGAIVTEARLVLNMTRTVAGETPVAIHRVLADWGEGVSNANLEEGSGAASQSGDATWLHRFYQSDFWSTSGGDFIQTESGSQIVSGISEYTWLSTPAMIADVQNWLVNPQENFGWLIKGDESKISTAKRFASRSNPVDSLQPKLVVIYGFPNRLEFPQTVTEDVIKILNYPNPFNSFTNISFELLDVSYASLTVYDITGRKVAELLRDKRLTPGQHNYSLNAGNLAGGVYFYQLKLNRKTNLIRRMVLLK